MRLWSIWNLISSVLFFLGLLTAILLAVALCVVFPPIGIPALICVLAGIWVGGVNSYHTWRDRQMKRHWDKVHQRR